MDNAILIIEMPTLNNDEAVASLHNFIHELLFAFEAHYHQLQQFDRQNRPVPNFDDGKDPF